MTSPKFTVLAVAGLGAYTTFSSFARDAVALVELGQLGRAAGYIAASCLLAVLAAAAGVAFAQ
jgi:CrcB protein